MAKKNKLTKFSENITSPNVLEPGKARFNEIKGNWNSFFGNYHPLIVELACGWGEYTISLAEKFPDRNYVGVDIKGDRIWKGSQYALENSLQNVAFLRTHIVDIEASFAEQEVDEFWLTFPDPRPKKSDEKHRLSNAAFLTKYQRLLKPDGWFKFKTDNTELFEYTLQLLADRQIRNLAFTFDLYHSELKEDHFGIKTKYEKIWTQRGEQIKYMKFKFIN